MSRLLAPGRVVAIDYSRMDGQSYAVILSWFLSACQSYRTDPAAGSRPGVVQVIDEGHRLFENDSTHSESPSSA
jgi:hypothetical protein